MTAQPQKSIARPATTLVEGDAPPSFYTLNPDFYQAIELPAGATRMRQVICSTLENLHLYQATQKIDGWVYVDPSMDLCVYADKVTVHGCIQLKADFNAPDDQGPVTVKTVGSIRIVARHLAAEDVPLSDGKTSPATLDVTPGKVASWGTFVENGRVKPWGDPRAASNVVKPSQAPPGVVAWSPFSSETVKVPQPQSDSKATNRHPVSPRQCRRGRPKRQQRPWGRRGRHHRDCGRAVFRREAHIKGGGERRADR